MTKSYLAEITTEAATGEIARIYDEIRRLTGSPLVALIYRHLATMPGALEAVWGCAAPLLETGELQARAWEIAGNAWSGEVPAPSAGVRNMRGASRVDARNVIGAYNRSNPVNYMIVRVIRAAATRVQPRIDQARSETVGRTPWSPPPHIESIASIPALDALSTQVRAMVEPFVKSAEDGAPMLVPTLYRHIAHWPALLSMTAREVAPRLESGEFAQAIQTAGAAISDAATRMARDHAVVADPLLTTPELIPVFERFSEVIPEMIVVGHFLEQMLDHAWGPRSAERTT